jgi:hypothetical protein
MRDLIRRFVAERRGGTAAQHALPAGFLGATTALALAALGALDQGYEPVTVVTSQAYQLSTNAASEPRRASRSPHRRPVRGWTYRVAGPFFPRIGIPCVSKASLI